MTAQTQKQNQKPQAPAPANKPASNATPPPAAPTSDAAKEPRKRNFLSPQKQFAIQIAGLVAIFNRKEVAALLTEPEQAQVKAASTMAEDLNSKTIAPITDRIKVIQTEFQALAPKIAEPGTAEKVKDLSIELGRLQKRLQTLTSAATA